MIRPVDVLAISGNPQIAAALQRSRRIPIVMIVSTKPVEAGLVSSLARPAGNVTGMYAELDASLNGKRLALLKQAFPQAARVAFLHDGRVNSMTGGITAETVAAAKTLVSNCCRSRWIPTSSCAGPWMPPWRVAPTPYSSTLPFRPPSDQGAFHAFAERHKLPAIHTYASAVTTGGLMFYGNDSSENYRLAADYIDRILRGANPGELPVQQATRYLLTINLKAARRIRLVIPAEVLAQADRVIQ